MVYLSTKDSLDQSIDVVVNRYSSLFNLPSYGAVVLLLALFCICAAILCAIEFLSLFQSLLRGLALGFSLFLVNLVLDYVLSTSILKQDPIYDLRRTAALSLFCWALWLPFIFVGVATAMLAKLCLLGFSAVLILRLIVFNSTSSVQSSLLLAASLLQPLSCVILLSVFPLNADCFDIFFFLIFSTAVSILSSYYFISRLNLTGNQTLGIPSLSFFKAFLQNWIADLNAPFEELLEKLGEEQDVKVSLIRFDASRPKALLIVPSVHPGPFKNVGSSLLPSMLKTTLEKQLNCVVCVPHGLLGHEVDLASQHQNQRIINHTIESANFRTSETGATPFTKVSDGLATACCQVFGEFAVLSFTLAPKTTEDLPYELDLFVDEEAEKNELTSCIVVNAHNSINGVISIEEAMDDLKPAAANCLERASSSRRLPFEVGAATVMPDSFGLEEGMGPGGISVVVVRVAEQKAAYVVIDGNNMISGLREKILSTLKTIGIGEGEVFTTDTHSVNAVTLSKRGYYPIGEALDHEKLTNCVKEATLAAMSDLERANVGTRSITVPNIKVIGEKKLEALCLLIDKTLRKAKKTAFPTFAATGLILTLFLMLI